MIQVFVLSLLLAPVAFAQKQTAEVAPFILTAKSANVAQPGTPIKITVFRWSSDDERNRVVLPLDPAAQAVQAAAAAQGQGERGGRVGTGTRGQSGAGAGLDPNDPALAEIVQAARGRGGRGARGDAASEPADPISGFSRALSAAPTVGYIWTNETVGYSIKYAHRISLPNGGERLVLATDRRLGGGAAAWRPSTGTPTDYEFTVIEIRTDSGGVGEGKTSLTSKVILDNETKTLALDNPAAAPAVLQSVKH